MSSLLPPNSTRLERALADAGIAPSDLSQVIRSLWAPETCPPDVLPWLAWALSVDDWSASWSEQQKRGAIKASYSVHRIKGTIGAVRTALGALGLPARVQEWFSQSPPGTPYTFRLLLDVEQQALSQADLQKILQVASSAKNLRSHLDVALLSVTSIAAPRVAVVSNVGIDVDVSYSAPSYADGTPAFDLLTDAAEHGEASTIEAIDSLHTLLHSTMTPSYW